MYKSHFGLQENPFTINTDPRYLYLTERTQEAIEALMYGIRAGKGFILLTGEVGTGKTTLLNKLLETLHEQSAATAFVFNPRMTASQLFEYMVTDFGIQCKSRARNHLLFKLHQWLLERYQNGEQTVLVVDEAQVLSRQSLEEIRLLTNLETTTHKLLQIVLAGQPEIEQKLNQRQLRQLRQRITLRVKTLPLTLDETRGYLVERLRTAGCERAGEIFTPEAMEAIHLHARGIARVTNLLAEQAMTRAFFHQCDQVSAAMVNEVAKEMSLDELDPLSEPVEAHEPRGRRSRRRRVNARRSRKSDGTAAAQQDAQPIPAAVMQTRLPLFIYGYGADGQPFYEHTHTIATNERGGLISMSTPVRPGQRLLITNKENECSQECVVGLLGARLARGVDVAFEFANPMPQFWQAVELEKSAVQEMAAEACA